jgi:sporulation protein YlmC with PRC-barrel domain
VKKLVKKNDEKEDILLVLIKRISAVGYDVIINKFMQFFEKRLMNAYESVLLQLQNSV